MGRLIPAGTGLGAYKRLTVDVSLEDEDMEEAEDGASYRALEMERDAESPAEAQVE